MPTAMLLAQDIGGGDNGGGSDTEIGGPGGDTQVQSVTIKNPLKVGTIEALLSSILSIVMILVIPLVVFFIIYSGFQYVMARGNPGEIEKATKSLTYAIIGGILVVGAVAISEIVKNLVSSFSN
jgi:hypothetical protein